MFPIGDDNREITTTPWVTYLLVLANVAVFIYEISLGDQRLQTFILHWGLVPALVFSGHGLITIFTAMFIHGGFLHIIGNMLYLMIFGDNVEDRMGHLRFFLFYFACGILAFVAHLIFNFGSSIPSVGASGAIAGVLGAYVVMFARNRVRVFWIIFVTWVPAWVMIGIWAATQFLNVYASVAYTDQTNGDGVAYAAHVGGFIVGVVAGVAMRRRQPARASLPGW